MTAWGDGFDWQFEASAEQERLYATAILGAAVTGIANMLWYIPVTEGRQGPRETR